MALLETYEGIEKAKAYIDSVTAMFNAHGIK